MPPLKQIQWEELSLGHVGKPMRAVTGDHEMLGIVSHIRGNEHQRSISFVGSTYSVDSSGPGPSTDLWVLDD